MLYTYLKTQWFEWKEQRRVQKLFYTNRAFAEQDLQLLAKYKNRNPYAISSQFLKKRASSNIHIYGETPLTTMAQIVKECDIRPQDRVIEMGGGRGRVGLFLAAYYQCRVITIEQIEEFVEKGVKCDNHDMVLGDMFKADLRQADVIYLYGTMLEDVEIQLLAEKFSRHTKIITVSYPLSAYHPHYTTIKTMTGRFPWGKTEVYLNERTIE